MDEDKSARRVLDAAYRLSRPLRDPSTRSKASCALASVLSRESGEHRSNALIQEGLEELPADPRFDLDRVFCLLRSSEVTRNQESARDAVGPILAAQQLLRKPGFSSELRELHAYMDLAESYRTMGRHREALSAFEQASAKLEALGRGDTQTAGTLFNNWGMSLLSLGRPLEAEKLFQRAIEISSGGNQEGVSPMLLINSAQALRDLSRLSEAARNAESGFARGKQAGDEVVVTQSLQLLASIYCLQGDVKRADASISEVEKRLSKVLPAGHIAFASIAYQRALNAQARGNPEDALNLVARAIEMTDALMKNGGQGSDFMPSLLVRQSEIELQLHRTDAAAADGARAVELVQKASEPGALSSRLGRAHLVLGRALQAQGKHAEAHTAFQITAENFEKALGAHHPDTIIARQALVSIANNQ
jgi:tetratricopeptide (TPR) repeat protein